MSQEVGTGPGGLVLPDDLQDERPGGFQVKLVDEAAALGNGADSVVEEAPAPGNGGDGPDAAPADKGNAGDRDWTDLDFHTERILDVLRSVLANMDEKGELILGKLLKRTEEGLKGSLRDLKLHVTGSVGMAGREQAAAAWRGPAEALRLLGGALTGLSEKTGQEAIETKEFTAMFPVLKTAEELLLRACQHEEGRLPVIDEALGGTGTHGARVGAAASSVGEAVALVEKMMRGTEAPGRKAVSVLIAGCIVQLGGVFGAEGENSEFVQRVERLRQERAGPVEGAESNDVRAFRADFGKEVERLRRAMRWRERGIWAAGLAVCLLLGWGVGISGVDFSFAGRLL